MYLKIILPQNFKTSPVSSVSSSEKKPMLFLPLVLCIKTILVFGLFSFMDEFRIFTLAHYWKLLTMCFGEVFFIVLHIDGFFYNAFSNYFVDHFLASTLSEIPCIQMVPLGLVFWIFFLLLFFSSFPTFSFCFWFYGDYLDFIFPFLLCFSFFHSFFFCAVAFLISKSSPIFSPKSQYSHRRILRFLPPE